MSQSQVPPPSSQRPRVPLTHGPLTRRTQQRLRVSAAVQRLPPLPINHQRKGLPALEPGYTQPTPSASRLVDEDWPEIWDSNEDQTRRRLLTAYRNARTCGLYEEMLAIDKHYNLMDTPFLSGSSRFRNSRPTDHIRQQCLTILTIIPEDIIIAMLTGRLTKVPNLRPRLIPDERDHTRPTKPPTGQDPGVSTDRKFKECRPALYCNILANLYGRHLTCNQMRRLIRYLRMYIKGSFEFFNKQAQPPGVDHRRIRQIDTWENTKTSVRRGHVYDSSLIPLGVRKYIKAERHLERIEEFIDGMEYTLSRVPAGKENEELPSSIYETGFSVNPVARLSQHKAHSGSVHVMNLIEACLSQMSNGLDQYSFRQFIVLELWKPDAATLAEHIISILTMSYLKLGGCNSKIAGESVTGAHTTAAWTYAFWAKKQRWNIIQTRIQGELDWIKEQKKLDAKMRKAWDMASQASQKFAQLLILEQQLGDKEYEIKKSVDASLPYMTKWLENVEKAWKVLKEEEQEKEMYATVADYLDQFIVQLKERKRETKERHEKAGVLENWPELM